MSMIKQSFGLLRKFQPIAIRISFIRCLHVQIVPSRWENIIFHQDIKFQFRKKLKLMRNLSQDASQELDALTYNRVAEETLESLSEYFDEILSSEKDADVTLGNGVLTIQLGNDRGVYVINKQTPNKQIWLSSPVSGPKRYDFVNNQWIYYHDGCSLHELLNKEISKLFKKEIHFNQCTFSNKSS